YAVLGLFIFAAVGIGVTYMVYLKRKAAKETEWVNEANGALEGRQFQHAARRFDDLNKNYPKSKDGPKYRFLKDYANALDPVWNVGPALQRRKDFSTYLQKTRDASDTVKGFLEERQKEVWDGLVRVTDDQVAEAEKLVQQQKFDEAIEALKEFDN